MKSQNGVTLVALVITIIVLLILAGVSLTLLVSPDNVISKGKEAAAETKNAVDAEQAQVNTAMGHLDNYISSLNQAQ